VLQNEIDGNAQSYSTVQYTCAIQRIFYIVSLKCDMKAERRFS